MAQGLPNKTIAYRLAISEHTVKFHVGAILAKLGAASRTEAVTLAARQGLLML
jgi:DNA-binding NarL/FixJ family response regulator